MSEKIIFFDFDNTIFDHKNNTIPMSALRALRKLSHRKVIATGRPYFLIQPYLELLGIDDCICFNGNYVIHRNKNVYSNPMSSDLVAEVVSFSLENHVALILEGVSGMRATVADDENMIAFLKKLNLIYPPVDPDYYKSHEIYQLSLFFSERNEALFYERFPQLHCVPHAKFGMDVVESFMLKEQGVDFFLETYGIERENAYAFGDGNNDVGLFEKVGVGIALGNACDELKAVATSTAAAVDCDGLFDGLLKAGLLDD